MSGGPGLRAPVAYRYPAGPSGPVGRWLTIRWRCAGRSDRRTQRNGANEPMTNDARDARDETDRDETNDVDGRDGPNGANEPMTNDARDARDETDRDETNDGPAAGPADCVVALDTVDGGVVLTDGVGAIECQNPGGAMRAVLGRESYEDGAR